MFKKGVLSIFFSLLIAAQLTITGSAKVMIEDVGNSIFPSNFMPAEGNVGALVIPVEFVDFRFQEDPGQTLEAMFSGEGTAYVPSVVDYFARASYGEMQLTPEVQPVVRLSGTRKSYSGDHAKLISDLLTVLTDRGVDLNEFDRNQDGILDGLYLVWAGRAESAGSDWWPYSDIFYFDFEVCGIRIGSFSSLSYELMTQDSQLRQYTAIHETGHQLGLTDYYANSYTSGTNAAVMMDRNEGDEDCFSKMLLGWITPQVITSSSYVTLQPASSKADAALIAPSGWDGNYLSEYFMAEYVMPEANQSNQPLSAGGGVRIWHVNAATSQWTDEITASMYRSDNSGNGAKLLCVVDAEKEWYYAEDGIDEGQTLLYSGESSGIEIEVDRIENEQARLKVTYFGEEPAEPEEFQANEPDDSVQDSEEDLTEAGENGQDADSNVEKPDDDVSDEEIGGEETDMTAGDETVKTEQEAVLEGEEAEQTKKKLPQAFPVLFLIGLGVLVYLLLKGDKKRKHKKGRKRRK